MCKVLTTTTAREARRAGETRKRRRRSTSNASSRARKRNGRSSTPSRRPRDARSGCKPCRDARARRLAETRARICGRRRLDRQGDDVGAPDNRQPQRALLLLLNNLGGGRRRARGGRLVLLALGSAEFFRVGEDEVHVLVEGEHLRKKVSNCLPPEERREITHLTGHLAAVVQRDAHPVVDLSTRLDLRPPIASSTALWEMHVRSRPRHDAPCQFSDVNMDACTVVSAGSVHSPSCPVCLSPTSWRQDATE